MNKRATYWSRADWLTGLVAATISLCVYIWSAAPNVTLLDSGEFIVAAQHFGVPHPTGYPLWTLLNWLFLLLPLGNAAWEVAIFSGICAALSVGLCATLLSNLQSWCFDHVLTGKLRLLPNIIALAFSLMLAFSQSMWTQAVIAEVYALHALLIAIYLFCCYAWTRNPASDRLMLAAFFTLTLSFSNHQLTMVLAPLPFLLIILLRRRAFFDWLFAGLLTLLLGYLCFANLSEDLSVLKTAVRFSYCAALAFAVFVWLRRFRVRWKLIAYLPVAVALGLLPHLYMPLASATNPPMNWGYAREPAGFYFSFNRSQYPGTLANMSVKSLGRLMGVTPPIGMSERPKPAGLTTVQMAQLWIGFFWQKLLDAFSPFAIIGYFASIILILRLKLDRRVWVYFLHIAFLLAAFLQPITANTKIDNGEWWTQMPYHSYTNLIFAILSGLGMGLLIEKLVRRRAIAFWLGPALLLLPIFTFRGSEASSNQRNHWFGWDYGHDMLKDLPKGSVVIGGTDAGRFIPTYMIFGESTQPAKFKRDPTFDRRDLYIITQNALGEPTYMKYLRDHYTTSRPRPTNAFERWLGRATAYPEHPLIIPDESQIKETIRAAAKEVEGKTLNDNEGNSLIFGSVLKWIWEKNRDKHEFFIEESFPLVWTYDYAVPHGMTYRLNKTKLDAIPPEAVERDFAFWKDYKERLLSNPAYKNDYDAQRSFSKLRQSIANLYRYRKMSAEAVKAYWEAIELWPDNIEAIVFLMEYQWERGAFDEVIDLFKRTLTNDPENLDLWRLLDMAEKRKVAEVEIQDLERKLLDQPKSRETLQKLIGIYASVGSTNRTGPLLERALKDFPQDTDMLRFVIRYRSENNEIASTIEPAKRLVSIEGSNVENYLLLSRGYFVSDNKKEFYETAQKAVELGGPEVREGFRTEPIFSAWSNDPEFKKLTSPEIPPSP